MDDNRNREDWMLARPWQDGKEFGAIVCDPPQGHVDQLGDVAFYGGVPILESCPKSIRKHIIDLHNRAIEVKP